MPIKLDKPVVEIGPSTEADIFTVTRININAEAGTVGIHYRKQRTVPPRYENKHDADGHSILIDPENPDAGYVQEAILQGPELIAQEVHEVDAKVVGALKPDGLKTWEANLKAWAYKELQDAGVFPAGRVE